MSKTPRSTSSSLTPADAGTDQRVEACEQFVSESALGTPVVAGRAVPSDPGEGDALTLFAREDAIVATEPVGPANDPFDAFASEDAVSDGLLPASVVAETPHWWPVWRAAGVAGASACLLLVAVAGWLRSGMPLESTSPLPADGALETALVVAPPPPRTGGDPAQPAPAPRDRVAAIDPGPDRPVSSLPVSGPEPPLQDPVPVSPEPLAALSLPIATAPGPQMVRPTSILPIARREEDDAGRMLPRSADAPAVRTTDVPLLARAVAAAPPVEPAIALRTAALDPAEDETRIRHLLDRFKTAYERLDPKAAQVVWPSVDVRALERAFDSLAAQEIAFEDCSLDIAEGRARATCQGRGTYVPKVGDRAPRTLHREWAFELERTSSDWLIAHTEAR